MGMPSEAELQNLVDRAAIYDLFCRYCDALDYRQWELLDDVFTPSAITYWPSGTEEQGLEEMVVKGRQESVHFLRQVFEDFGPTHHLISNVVLNIDGDTGSATCRVRAHHLAEAHGKRIFEESLARFSGRIQRSAEGWRFEDFRESIAIALGDPDELSTLIQERGLA